MRWQTGLAVCLVLLSFVQRASEATSAAPSQLQSWLISAKAPVKGLQPFPKNSLLFLLHKALQIHPQQETEKGQMRKMSQGTNKEKDLLQPRQSTNDRHPGKGWAAVLTQTADSSLCYKSCVSRAVLPRRACAFESPKDCR